MITTIVILHARQWVRLPGTAIEIYLKGKARSTNSSTIRIRQTASGRPHQFGGWPVPPGRCYWRKV